MKKILVTGGMLTYMVLFNAGVTSAQMLPDIAASELQTQTINETTRHEKNFDSKIGRLADKLGLDADELAVDVQSNKTIKQILKKHGITKNQLREIMSNKHTTVK